MRTLLVLLATVTLVTVCSAKGKHCKYKKGGKWSDCTDGKQTSTKVLDEGSDPACEATKVKTRPCVPGRKEKCKYEKGNWSECDENNTQTRTMTLVNGNCPNTKTKTRKCKKVPGCKYRYKGRFSNCDKETLTKTRQIKLKKKKEGSECPETLSQTVPCKYRKNGCKYQKGVWSECNPTTKKMTRKLTLTDGGSHCLQNKMREKRCKKSKAGRKACKYKRGPWSQCDPVTNQMLRTMTLKRGNRDKCEPIKKVTRRCRRRAALSAAKIHSKCKYEPADWQQCDLRTNTMTRQMNLVQGDPEKCASTRELKRKCRKPCKFRKGSWSPCDPSTGLMTRVDRLVKGDTMFCSSSRHITKKCKKGKRKCQYDIGDWSDCDLATNERKRIKTLKKGDPATCKATIEMKKACSRPNGKERCFFGKWGEYGTCMNGVLTKTRELIQGGTECERKAVKTKACS